ncbi:4Fe-4S binding protein [Candidatus Dojkabacteria bacterium]|nr:4Fe-4S binding protein [Candidatus Dojkabacteria bacterium]
MNKKNTNKKLKDFKPETTENEIQSHTVFAGLCKGCRICQEVCPQKCIGINPTVRGVYNNKIVQCDISKCTACQICQRRCPEGAIRVEKKKIK